jgi:hypothetical protein
MPFEKKHKDLIVDSLLENINLEDIESLMFNWNIINENLKRLNEMNEALKDNIKIFLKERNWNRYSDRKTKISVTILKQKKTSVDIKQLRMLLTQYQIDLVTKTTEFEKLIITTEEMRLNLQKHLKVKKDGTKDLRT